MNKNIEAQTYTTEIQRLDGQGAGRAVVWRENKKGNIGKLSLTVPYTLPGEQVTVTVDKPLMRKWRTKADEILETHPQRVEAPCPHFSLCGGCTWQHWSYEGQLAQKTNHVRQVLEAQGFDADLVEPTIGMENPWHYRNKMEFTFAVDGSLGLHEAGNFRKVIPLETCLIMQEDVKDAVLEIGNWVKENEYSGYHKETHEGLFRHVMVRKSFETEEVMIAIFATEAPNEIAEVDTLVQQITANFPQVKSFMWFVNTDVADRTQAEETHILAGRDFIYDKMYGYQYRLWFDTFFQTNPVQAEKLVDYALEMADPQPTDNMIDLFCGVGTFSLPFASRVKHLSGVEIVETSIESAKRNATDNGIDNTYFLAKDARRGIDDILEEFGRPDLLLIDPPRSGAGGKVMRRIGRAQPEQVVYVSCNPDSFAVDIKQLAEFGYELVKVQPVDLFPQTYHVELVALMSRIDE